MSPHRTQQHVPVRHSWRGKERHSPGEAFMSQKRFDATKLHTHTFALDDLPRAIRYAEERVDNAIKVVVKARGVAAHRVAAE